MIDYSKLSDFEINERVAKALRIPFETTYYDEVFTWDDKQSGRFNTRKFNPCQNWADAGPVVEKYRIHLTPVDNGWFVSDMATTHWISDKNPLRAAMIIFLMMKEKWNE